MSVTGARHKAPQRGRVLLIALLPLTVLLTGAGPEFNIGNRTLLVDDQNQVEGGLRELRAQGKYGKALDLLDTNRSWLYERMKNGTRVPDFTTIHVEEQLATLRLLRDLPPGPQKAMKEADSLAYAFASIWRKGNYSAAAALQRRRLEILPLCLGAHHPEVAFCLHDLAASLSHMGAYGEAEPVFRQALALLLELYGWKHPRVGITLEYLGDLYAEVGDDRAEGCYQDALEIYQACGLCPPGVDLRGTDVVRLWARIAKLHIDQGDYAQAMPWLRNGLAAYRGHYRRENWLTAMLLDHQALILWRQGQYAEAVPLFREALDIRIKELGETHPHTIQSLNALGAVLSECGEPSVAEPLLREALARFRSIRGNVHPDVATALHNLAALMRTKGDLAAEDSLCREALAICREYWGKEHSDVATCLYRLAAARMEQGRFREAEEGLWESLTMYKGLLDKNHPAIVQSRHDLARCLLAEGELAPAESLMAEAADAFDAARLRVGSGFARATFQASPFEALAAVRLMRGKMAEAWPAVERSHGRALADLLVRAGHRTLSPGEHTEQDSLARTLDSLETAVMKLDDAAHPQGALENPPDVAEARARLAIAEAAWYRFQAEVDSRHPVTEGQAFSLLRVQGALTDRTALMGWLYLDIGRAEPVAWGYVVRNRGPVRWVRLKAASAPGEARTLAEQARDFREALAIASCWIFRPTSVERINGEASDLCRRWLAPLFPYLDGVEHLVVITSGPMLGIPMETLVDESGHCLGDRYTISYAPSATVYTWLCESGRDQTAPSPRHALLVGDPPFTVRHLREMEQDRRRTGAPSEMARTPTPSPLQATVLRSALAGSEDALDSLPRLPWTRAEVKGIASLMPAATVLLGPDASWEQLNRLAESEAMRRFDTIHLATHALVDDASPEHSALVLSRTTAPHASEPERPDLLLDSHASLLTAKEIIRSWELNADLVTLSGCQTGLGRETTAEGFIGLAQAFLQVGARSVLVSLWKVEEEATSRLMVRFYENLTGKYQDERGGRRGEPMPEAQALQEAKRWMRDYTDSQGNRPFRHPTYWAGFVLVGRS